MRKSFLFRKTMEVGGWTAAGCEGINGPGKRPYFISADTFQKIKSELRQLIKPLCKQKIGNNHLLCQHYRNVRNNTAANKSISLLSNKSIHIIMPFTSSINLNLDISRLKYCQTDAYPFIPLLYICGLIPITHAVLSILRTSQSCAAAPASLI